VQLLCGLRLKGGQQALPNAPDITTQDLRNGAITAPCYSAVLCAGPSWALADERCSGGFTPEATVAGRCANTPKLLTGSDCRGVQVAARNAPDCTDTLPGADEERRGRQRDERHQ